MSPVFFELYPVAMHPPFTHPLQVGHRLFPSNLIQAPLAGISCAPFRQAISKFGGAAYAVTEMISAKTLLHRPAQRYIYKSAQEGYLAFQLSGKDAGEMAEAALIAVEQGADLIDINAGCPVEKIRKKKCGSALLAMSQEIERIIRQIKEKVHVPVSIKIRVDADSGEHFNAEVAQAVNDAGADLLIVHGRHWTEHYETPVHLDQIASMVQQSTIPVIGNGDVKDYASLCTLFEQTGCAGAMIGRASVGCPWLFQTLQAKDQGRRYLPPSTQEIGALFLAHIQGLIHLENEKSALLQARSLSKYYLRSSELSEAKQVSFHAVQDFKSLILLTERLFR